MSLKTHWFKSMRTCLSVLSMILVIAGCDNQLTDEQAEGSLRLIGTPPTTIFAGYQFEYQFGIAGGSGSYTMRYLKEPPPGYGFSEPETTNHVDLTLEFEPAAKPAFWLRGVADLPEGANASDFRGDKLNYYIEYSDGITTKVEEFSFILQTVDFGFITTTINTTEGSRSIFPYRTLSELTGANRDFVCDQVFDDGMPIEREINGRIAYPVAFELQLLRPQTTEVIISYSISSNYDEDLTEQENQGKARPDVDFVEKRGTITFRPGQRRCAIVFDIFQDGFIEGTETFTLSYGVQKGRNIQVDEPLREITIRDDEPDILSDPAVKTINLGDPVSIPVSIRQVKEEAVYVYASVNNVETEADYSVFEITPDRGFIEFLAGEQFASYGLRTFSLPREETLRNDMRVTLSLNVNGIEDLEDSVITLNEWPYLLNSDLEIVASEAQNEEAKSFVVTDSGMVLALVQTEADNGDRTVTVKGFYGDGRPYKLSDTSDNLVLSRTGMDLTAAGLIFDEEQQRLIVAFTSNGAYGAVHRGGEDFVLEEFKFEDGVFSTSSNLQFGTEADDQFGGIRALVDSEFIVFGSSLGRIIESNVSYGQNNGGLDGVVFHFDDSLALGVMDAFFIGDDEDNQLTSIGGLSEYYALEIDPNTDSKGAIRTSNNEGEPSRTIDPLVIDTDFEQNLVKIENARSYNSYYVLSDGLENPFTSNLYEAGGVNTQITRIEPGESSGPSFNIAGESVDRAVDFAEMESNYHVGILGYTLGVLDENISYGLQDIYLSVIDTDDNKIELINNLQFGTPGVDVPIKLIANGNSKFIVLWHENHTSGDGSIRYRISMISPDGEMLSPSL